MTIPGVGPVTSLAFKATIDDTGRFLTSKALGAHLGLTPRVYQSGEIDRSGHISKCGTQVVAAAGLGRCHRKNGHCAMKAILALASSTRRAVTN